MNVADFLLHVLPPTKKSRGFLIRGGKKELLGNIMHSNHRLPQILISSINTGGCGGGNEIMNEPFIFFTCFSNASFNL